MKTKYISLLNWSIQTETNQTIPPEIHLSKKAKERQKSSKQKNEIAEMKATLTKSIPYIHKI